MNGTYTAELEAYVADHFPLRDRFIALNFWLKEHRGFHDAQLVVYDLEDIGGGAVEDGWDQLAPLPEEALAELDEAPANVTGEDAIPAAIALGDMDLGDDALLEDDTILPTTDADSASEDKA